MEVNSSETFEQMRKMVKPILLFVGLTIAGRNGVTFSLFSALLKLFSSATPQRCPTELGCSTGLGCPSAQPKTHEIIDSQFIRHTHLIYLGRLFCFNDETQYQNEDLIINNVYILDYADSEILNYSEIKFQNNWSLI